MAQYTLHLVMAKLIAEETLQDAGKITAEIAKAKAEMKISCNSRQAVYVKIQA